MREDWVDCEAGFLGELIRGINYKKPQSSDVSKDGYLPILRANNIDSNALNYEGLKYVEKNLIKDEQKIKTGDIVFAMSSGSKNLVGKSGQAQKDYQGSFGAFCSVYRSNKSINPGFIQYYFHSGAFRRVISNASKGSNINNLKREHVLNAIIPLPPILIQRAIVAKIESLFSGLDKGISDLKTAQVQLTIYRQAVLKKAFEGELTKEWREQRTDLPTADELLEVIKEERQNQFEQQLQDWKNAVKIWEMNCKKGKKPAKPRKTKATNETDELLHTLPNKWKWKKLGNIVSKISDGPFGSNLKTSDYVDSGVRVIRLENISNLNFRDSKKSFISQEKYQSIKKHGVYPNDIIFSSFITENTSVVSIPKHIELAVNKADCFCVRFNDLVYYKFYEFFLSTRSTYSQLINEVHGATRPRINTTQLKEISVPLCSKREQYQIVKEIESRLSVCDQIEQSINEGLKKAEALRQSILKKAFEGSLLSAAEIEQCKQAPDYQPASVLLEKIKAEKNQ